MDGLGLHVAIMTCAGLGMVEACPAGLGRSDLTDDGWRSIEAAGFDVARDGKEGIHAFMERVHSTDGSLGHNAARNWGRLGRLFRFFDLHNGDEAFRPAYEVIAGFMADRRAIGGKVLGVPVTRKLHSLATASKEVGMPPRALRSVLAERGLLPEGHKGLTPGSVMVDADKLEGILASLAARWGERQVGEYLGIPVHQVRLLVGEKIVLASNVRGTGGSCLTVFDKEVVARLVSSLTDTVEVIRDERPGWADVNAVSEALGYPQAGIIRLLVDSELKAVGRLASEHGLGSLRFDVEEVRRKIPKRDLSRRETAQMLGIAMDTIARLKAAGHLRVRAKKVGEPHSRADFYLYQDVFAFAEKYVSIHNHTRSVGTRQDTARRRLSDRGVEPVLKHEICGADFYLKSEVGP